MADRITITESSLQKLRDELDYLRSTKRRELAEALRKARAFGDLSENFEYHAARREQAIVNGRIAQLEHIIDRATVVPDGPDTALEVAQLGSTVCVHDLDTDDDWEFQLVDPVQADPMDDRISIQSPVGAAMLGLKVGDEVEVSTPAGAARYRVVSIRH
jgi:transcription elongation factor GreA